MFTTTTTANQDLKVQSLSKLFAEDAGIRKMELLVYFRSFPTSSTKKRHSNSSSQTIKQLDVPLDHLFGIKTSSLR